MLNLSTKLLILLLRKKHEFGLGSIATLIQIVGLEDQFCRQSAAEGFPKSTISKQISE